MSRVSVTQSARKQSPLADMATLGPRLLSETLRSVGELLQQAVDASPELPKSGAFQPGPICEIPETECPPRCVCHIVWEASPREKLVCDVKVTNSGKESKAFTLEALPFPDPAGTIQVSPGSMTLNPGETRRATATYVVPQGLSSGRYETEILVSGFYEQCVTVTLRVEDRQHCECHLEQGEIPVRIRAHRWYDHFQCVEDCFEPARPKKEKRKKG